MTVPPTVTVTLGLGCPTFPLSSTARLSRLAVCAGPVPQLNVQFESPLARFQVLPPSTDTSTALTRPPPVSAAVPAMTTADDGGTVPGWGEVMVDVGASVSLDVADEESPACNVRG